MTKHFQILLAALFFTLPVQAQKVDLDGEKVPVQYLRMPKKPFPADYKYYSAIVSAKPNDLPRIGMSEKSVLQYAVVPGYKKVEKGGDFNIEVSLGDFRYEGNAEIKTNTTTTKDKSGKEIKTTTYNVETKFVHTLSAKLQDKTDKVLYQKSWNEYPQVCKSANFNSSTEAAKYIKDGAGRDVGKQDQDAIYAALANMKEDLARTFGYTPITENFKLQILDTEKHPDYAGFQQALKDANAAFATMRADKPLDSVRILSQSAIAFFEKQKDKYDAADKAGKKLKYACLYDLGLLHYWLENFDQAETFAQAVVANDFDPKDGKRLSEDIAEQRANQTRCSRSSSHFAMEFKEEEVAVVAEKEFKTDAGLRVEAFKEDKKALSENGKEFPGSLYSNGEEGKGSFLLDDPNFIAFDKNVRFAKDMEKNVYVFRPDWKKITEFSFDGRRFKCLPFQSASEMSFGSKTTTQVMEVLYESPTVMAFLAYTGEQRGLNNPPEYVIYKVSEMDMISLSGMKFALNLNKGIRKAFDACPDVVAASEKDGGFERNKAGITRLAEMLDSCWKK
ncbi:MAG: hypothetical protein H7246_11200 [Phycisphaerae bacterium]|nr:hypothetical protein [Saprospiraceae bacterium]